MFTPAYAQSATVAGGFDFMGILPILLIFVVFYFLLIRPQQKRVKEQKEMLSQLKRGDRVVTNGGIIGTVTKVVSDTELQVEIAEDVRVRVARSMISSHIAATETKTDAAPKKTEAVKAKKAPAKKVTTAKKTPAKKPPAKKVTKKV